MKTARQPSNPQGLEPGHSLPASSALALLLSGRVFVRVESRKTAKSFSFKIRQAIEKDADGVEVGPEPVWWARVRTGLIDYTYLATVKALTQGEAEKELRQKVAYLSGRGLTRIAERVEDERDFSECGIYRLRPGALPGPFGERPFLQVRLTRKSFSGGFNYKCAEFKALRHVLGNLAQFGTLPGVSVIVDQEPERPSEGQDDARATAAS